MCNELGLPDWHTLSRRCFSGRVHLCHDLVKVPGLAPLRRNGEQGCKEEPQQGLLSGLRTACSQERKLAAGHPHLRGHLFGSPE
jgi:hypothetical protein